MTKPIKVAVMNTSHEITDLLEQVMRTEGFETQSFYTYLFKHKKMNFEEYVATNNPDVIIFDVAIPYEENFLLFQKISQSEAARDIGFVITTTNKKALESFVGETKTHELIGKPYDLKEIINAVKTAYQKKRIA